MYIYLNTRRDGYTPEQCGKTMTVGELLDTLTGYDEDTPVYFRNDDGYTFGAIYYADVVPSNECDDEGDEE